MRHHGGNALIYQDHREGLRTLPLKTMDCEKSLMGSESYGAYQGPSSADVVRERGWEAVHGGSTQVNVTL